MRTNAYAIVVVQRNEKRKMVPKINKTQSAFTIVELLIVIVVIAILAAISLVAFNGVQTRAVTAVLESDLGSASKQLQLFKADKGVFPATLSTDCAASQTSDTNLCIKPSGDNVVENYTSPSPYTTFSLTIKHVASGLSGTVTDSSSPVVSAGAAGGGGEEVIVIGSQTWAKKNVNVGTMVAGIDQTDNGVLEKYCPDNNEANCSTHGALYQRGEAMQYVNSPGARGVCPAGWHVPTDDDWKTLEKSLGMSQQQADASNYRGTNQGTALMTGGSSGLDIPMAGQFQGSGHMYYFGSRATLWSSTKHDTSSSFRVRRLFSNVAQINRDSSPDLWAHTVRCVKD